MLTDLNEMAGATGFPRLNKAFGWFESRKAQVVLAAIILQFAVLGAMIVKSAMPIVTGQTVLVRVVPIDPRDFFRGEYVILSYDFSRVPEQYYAGKGSNSNPTIFVTLVPDTDGKHWKAGTYSTERPTSGLYLEGRIAGWRGAEYGIESFFVEEGKGKGYEQAVRDRKLSAEIAVDANGKAAVKNLVVE